MTNELVISFALKDCERCAGAGFFTASVNGGEQKPQMCVCSREPFHEAYEGRLRRTKEGRLEYRPLAVAESIDE